MRTLTTDELKDVTYLVFAEQILCVLANKAKPKSRRRTKILTAIDNIHKADLTYDGVVPAAWQEEGTRMLEEIEIRMNELCDE